MAEEKVIYEHRDRSGHGLADRIGHPGWKSVIKALFVTAIVIFVGLFEFSLFFSDLVPGESIAGRYAAAGLILFVSGLIIGYLYPGRWVLAGFTTWLVTFIGTVQIVSSVLAPSEIPEGARILRIVVSEGEIRLNTHTLEYGKLCVEQVNEGTEEHRLAFLSNPRGKEAHQVIPDGLGKEDIRASLRPLKPGKSDISVFNHYFKPGCYVVFCTRRTSDGKSHSSLGEIEEFTVE